METNFYVYLLVAAGTLYLIRMLPLSLIRKDITNKYIRSFLFYVPYVTLSVMTFQPFCMRPVPYGRGWPDLLQTFFWPFLTETCFVWRLDPAWRYMRRNG